MVDATLVEEALKENLGSFAITMAQDGEEALRLIYSSEVRPDIILLDLNLPRKSGLEVLEELKKDHTLRAIPVIIMTNSKSEEDVTAAYSYHCNAYVRKPIGFDRLSSTVGRLVQFWANCASLPKIRTTDMSMPPTE